MRIRDRIVAKLNDAEFYMANARQIPETDLRGDLKRRLVSVLGNAVVFLGIGYAIAEVDVNNNGLVASVLRLGGGLLAFGFASNAAVDFIVAGTERDELKERSPQLSPTADRTLE